MKVKLFVHEGNFGARLGNGDQFSSNEDESRSEFIERIENYVELDCDDTLQTPIQEIDLKKMKKETTQALERRLPLLDVGVETQMIREILIMRGVDLQAEEIEVEDPKVVKSKKGKASKTKKQKKDKKVPESIKALRKSAEANVGKPISFLPFKKDSKMVNGVIKQVSVDLRSNLVYYRIDGEDGNLYHKKTDNNSIVISK